MFRESFWGADGFDELRKHIRQNVEMCKDICAVLQERVELESAYAKQLGKLAGKLSKVTNAGIGTLAEAWGLVGAEMETEAEQHRMLSQAISDEVCKTIKSLIDAQGKTRKSVESTVDKCAKMLAERRDTEVKCKRVAAQCMKDRERAYDMLSTSPKTKDKDVPKLEKKTKQLDDQALKADKEYFDSCKKLEAARAEYDCSIYKAAGQLQQLEEERITAMRDALNKYNTHLSAVGPKLVKSCDKVAEAAHSIDVQKDINVASTKGNGPRQSQQFLPDYYAEDSHMTMDFGRRKECLQTFINLINIELERERKSLDGVEKLADVYHNRPTFADADTRDQLNQRHANVSAMLRWLEASRHKAMLALAHYDGHEKPQSSLAQYIEQTRDKQGNSTYILRLPSTSAPSSPVQSTPSEITTTTTTTTTTATATTTNTAATTTQSRAGDTSSCVFDEDEFDAAPIGRCSAIYHYAAQQYDELSIEPGDVISIYSKQEDGWWQGELDGHVGIFPSTYVQQL